MPAYCPVIPRPPRRARVGGVLGAAIVLLLGAGCSAGVPAATPNAVAIEEPPAVSATVKPRRTPRPAAAPILFATGTPALDPDAPGWGARPPTSAPGQAAAPAKPVAVLTRAPRATPPPGGLLTLQAALSSEACNGSVTVYVTVTNAEGTPVRGASVSGRVFLEGETDDLSFAAMDAKGAASAGANLGRPRRGCYVPIVLHAETGYGAGLPAAMAAFSAPPRRRLRRLASPGRFDSQQRLFPSNTLPPNTEPCRDSARWRSGQRSAPPGRERAMPELFKALVVDKQDGQFSVGVRDRSVADLPAGQVTIRVAYSSVNYKDGLACTTDGRIIRDYPMIPGVDVSGAVTESADARFKAGDRVLVTGFDQGVLHPGGFAEYTRVPADWVVKLPAGLSLREAMALGTAGFTAALSVQRLEENGLRPGNGPVLVSGATGGVGSTAVSMLAGLGYEVAASTGKADEHEFLRGLGAKEILPRAEVSAQSTRSLEQERWAAGVDPVGGDTLAYMVRTTKYGGSVASSGLTGGTTLNTTVFPFILRGVNLLGIESVMCPMAVRLPLWQRLATDLKPRGLSDSIAHEITLEQIPAIVPVILRGGVKGRTVVRIGGEA